jgi:predicted anti-sigma-YlaC factor YlaD
MTTNSHFNENSQPQNQPDDLRFGNDKHTNESTGAMDMVKRDRFELLSAYLDGEVTAAERKQVEEWLASDPTVQRLYTRLLKLRQSVRTLPVPESQQSVEQTVEQVMARLRRRSRLVWLGGGAAVAACVIGTVSGLFPGVNSGLPQFAQQSIQKVQPTTSPEAASPLMVAINNPVIPIPKAAEATPEKPVINEMPLEPLDLDSLEIN